MALKPEFLYLKANDTEEEKKKDWESYGWRSAWAKKHGG